MLKRRSHGNIAEFAPALFMFFMFFLLPLINLGFIPVRYGLAMATINEVAHRLSRAEKMSQAYGLLQTDNKWRDFLKQFGVTVTQNDLSIIAQSVPTGNQVIVNNVGGLSQSWLPNGANWPCTYSLDLKAVVNVPPLWQSQFGGMSIPGLTSAIAFTMHSRSNWENFGKDPETQVYYVNE